MFQLYMRIMKILLEAINAEYLFQSAQKLVWLCWVTRGNFFTSSDSEKCQFSLEERLIRALNLTLRAVNIIFGIVVADICGSQFNICRADRALDCPDFSPLLFKSFSIQITFHYMTIYKNLNCISQAHYLLKWRCTYD